MSISNQTLTFKSKRGCKVKKNSFWSAMMISIIVLLLVGSQPNLAIGDEDEFKGPPWAEAIYTRMLPKRVFVTSESYQGNLGRLAGADAKCQALADQAGLNGTFKAWLSIQGFTPMTRFVHSQAHYMRNVRSTIIARNFSDLVDFDILTPIVNDENGNGVLMTPVNVWTGTESGGGPKPDNCNGWTTNEDNAFGDTGNYQATEDEWTDWEKIPCDHYARLYCFEQ